MSKWERQEIRKEKRKKVDTLTFYPVSWEAIGWLYARMYHVSMGSVNMAQTAGRKDCMKESSAGMGEGEDDGVTQEVVEARKGRK